MITAAASAATIAAASCLLGRLRQNGDMRVRMARTTRICVNSDSTNQPVWNESSFHTGWFVESLFTQILVVLAIRTRMSPFWRSRPSKQLGAAIVAALAAAVIIPLSPLGSVIGFGGLPWQFWLLLVGLVAAYLTMIEIVKRFFDRYETRRPEAVARQKARTRLAATTSNPQSNT